MARPTLLDVALRMGSDETEMAKAIIKNKPELGILPVRAVNGFEYNIAEYATRTAVSPRSHNQGSASIASSGVPITYKLAQWKERSEVDTSLLEGMTSVQEARERQEQAEQIVEAITDSYLTQVYYGDQSADPKTFNGFAVRAGSLNSTKANNSPIVIGEGGTGVTSIYAMRLDGMQPVELLYNSTFGPTPTVTDIGTHLVSDGSNNFDAKVSVVKWAAGLRMPVASIGRLANIDLSSNTVDLSNLSILRRLMGGGNIALFANPTVMSQLDDLASGSITYYADDANLATEIMTVYGMPVFSTDFITNSEGAVTS